VQVTDCSGPLTMARTALLGALVVLANALSAYVVVGTRIRSRRREMTLPGTVVAAYSTPKKRRRNLGAPKNMC
jgi:hypothetical protein